MEDREIINSFIARSEDAVKELEKKYGRLALSVAVNILNNSSDAEECVNDAYLGVWNSIPPARPDSLMAYICRITRNISLKRYRYNTAEKRNSQMETAMEELEEILADSKDVEQQVLKAELTGAVEKFMDGLKQTDRVIFMRRYYFADSYEVIARDMEMSEKNVSVRLARVRKKLRDHLKGQGYID